MQGREITFIERQMIELRLRAKVPVRQIERALGRRHGVVAREIERNRTKRGFYSAVEAQRRADERKAKRSRRPRKLDQDIVLQSHVIRSLEEGLKPHVIAGRLAIRPPPGLAGNRVSHEAIFRWIYEGAGRRLNLYRHLTHGRPRRQKQYARKTRSTPIPERISIHERPGIVDKRRDYGDWESDSVLFARQKPRLSVQYERKAKYVLIHRLADGTAAETEGALWESVLSLPQQLWQSITFDNGKEAMNHGNLRRTFGIRTYFCDPYASYQKGGVENANRIIRRYLPRSTEMTNLTRSDIYAIQEKINNIPRKSLGYRTPNEVMREACGY